jgi:hypothetical protein
MQTNLLFIVVGNMCDDFHRPLLIVNELIQKNAI